MAAISLTDKFIDANGIAATVASADYGAIVTFIGTVRGNSRGRRVLHLEYEAYAPLARKQLLALAAKAESQWNARCAIAHRLGHVEVGECSVVVSAASAHRAAAFEACNWLVDSLKATAPIWKKEYFEGGACWIEGSDAVQSRDGAAASKKPQ